MTSQIGDCLESLAATIHARREAGPASYTYRLLSGNADDLLKKLVEEAAELALAGKETLDLEALSDAEKLRALKASAPREAAERSRDHARYEAGDVLYHLLVICERLGISLDDLAAELNARMTPDALAIRPDAVVMEADHINRGKGD